MNLYLRHTIFILIILLVSTTILASPIYTSIFSNKAVSGYDTVAYFTQGKPIKGSSQFITKYKGATWYFSSTQNLATFKSNPTKYAPQYGGHCAWAVSVKKSLVKGSPKFWTIHKGKLYLNYDSSIQLKWLKNMNGLIQQADSYWPTLSN